MKLLKTIKHDYLEILPPAIFFFIAFTLILVTKRLILSEYGISWTGFGSAVIGAYLVGKVVLIVDKLPFVNRFPDRQLIYNASWKCLIYFLAARSSPIPGAYRSVVVETRKLYGSEPAFCG